MVSHGGMHREQLSTLKSTSMGLLMLDGKSMLFFFYLKNWNKEILVIQFFFLIHKEL